MIDLRGADVLVTGATGFIGRALCPALAARGARVHALSRSGGKPPGAEASWSCDAANEESLRRLVAQIRPMLVYHLAGHVTGSRQASVVLSTFHSKLTSTVNLLVATGSLPGCRVVLAGSLEEPDAAEPVPVSPYAAASAAAASYGALFHALFGQAVLHARLFMVYGPGDPNESRVIPYTIRRLLTGTSPELGLGTRPIDWIYIDDVVSGLIALGETASIQAGSFDLGSGVTHTVREVAQRIAEMIGSAAEIEFGAHAEPERERVRSADLAATRAQLGWSPRVALDEGLARTVAWMREHPTPAR